MNNNNFIQEIKKYLCKRFPEREQEIEGLIIGALIKEHVFLLGPPGTAKSELCRTFTRLLSGRHFSWLLTRFTGPEELFGPYSLEGLKKDRYVRITTGKLPECDFAFLDEIWKGNSAILNSLLSIANERIFFNGEQEINVPLRSIFGASNEVPEANETELLAIYDRFLFRYLVKPLSDNAFLKFMTEENNNNYNEPPTTSLNELDRIHEELKTVQIEDNIPSAISEIRHKLSEDGINPSVRRFDKSRKALKAKAYIDGRNQATVEDLEILQHILWDQPDQIPTIRKIILTASNPGLLTALEVLEACEEASNTAINASPEEKMAAGIEAASRIKVGLSKLETMTGPKINEIKDKITSLQKRVVVECLGLKT